MSKTETDSSVRFPADAEMRLCSRVTDSSSCGGVKVSAWSVIDAAAGILMNGAYDTETVSVLTVRMNGQGIMLL